MLGEPHAQRSALTVIREQRGVELLVAAPCGDTARVQSSKVVRAGGELADGPERRELALFDWRLIARRGFASVPTPREDNASVRECGAEEFACDNLTHTKAVRTKPVDPARQELVVARAMAESAHQAITPRVHHTTAREGHGVRVAACAVHEREAGSKKRSQCIVLLGLFERDARPRARTSKLTNILCGERTDDARLGLVAHVPVAQDAAPATPEGDDLHSSCLKIPARMVSNETVCHFN